MMNLYSIHDKKARVFQAPWPAPTDVHAMRSFTGAVNRADEENMLYKYPEDYELTKVGTFEEDTGIITAPITPEIIATAAAVMRTHSAKPE